MVYGRTLERTLASDVSLVRAQYGCGWQDGGCAVVARAVRRIVGGTVWAIVSFGCERGRNVWCPRHVLVKTPDDQGFLDAEGFTTEAAMRFRWARDLRADGLPEAISLLPWKLTTRKGLLTSFYAPAPACEHHTDPKVDDVVFANRIERRLRHALPHLLDPLEAEVLRSIRTGLPIPASKDARGPVEVRHRLEKLGLSTIHCGSPTITTKGETALELYYPRRTPCRKLSETCSLP